MRARRLIALLLIAASAGSAGLVACSTVKGGSPPAGLDLAYSETPEEGAKLAYGRDNSDDVQLMFQCRKGSGQVEIIEAYGPDRNGRLILSSRMRRAVLASQVTRDDETGEPDAIAWTTTRNPALQNFQTSGRLLVSTAGSRSQIAIKSNNQEAVSRFFGACGTV